MKIEEKMNKKKLVESASINHAINNSPSSASLKLRNKLRN